MADRPRTVWIGTDTPFVLEEFRNDKTGQLLTGIGDGTLKIYSEVDGALIVPIGMLEVGDTPGSYEALVPAILQGILGNDLLVEGMPLRLQFDISGGAGLSFRLDARAIARVKKDDGL